VWRTAAAQCVVTELEQRPECDAFALRWYLAMSYHLMSRVLDVDAARKSLERGLQRFAQEPQLRLGLGTVEEMGALRRVTQISTPPELRPGGWNLVKPARPTRDRRTCRLLAEREYRRALEADPALVEAHLRRGRVSAELGRTDDAEHELEWVVGHSREPSMLYLAHLFRGAIHQRAGRLDAAAVSYRSAVAQDPACQTGNLALGHVLEQLGERAGALEAWRRATAGHDHDDAWWLYPLGRLRRSEALLAALRQEATR
jgi:tetratricopeptide (TPR) repeat protein